MKAKKKRGLVNKNMTEKTKRTKRTKNAKGIKNKTTNKLAAKKSSKTKTTRKANTKVTNTGAKAAGGKRKGAFSGGNGLKIGDSVASVSLVATGNQTVNLAELSGKKIVLYFYPKDDTPGCTLEGKDFSALKSEFSKLGAEVFGVSKDNLKSHEKFKEKYTFQFDLLSDEDEKLCQHFGVIKMKNMYGREYMGIERSTFVIDTNGKIVKEWRGVKVPGHAQEVLDFIQSLS